MERVLYLEPDEEITSVIDRMKKLKAKNIALVVPRDAVVLQSVVNLKLLKKEAEDLKKEMSLVTSDKVGRNLAAQVGIATFDKLDKEFLEPEEELPEPPEESKDLPKDKKIEDLEKAAEKPEETLFEKAKALEPEKAKPSPLKPAKSTKKPLLGKPKIKLNKKLLIFGAIFSLFVITFIIFLFLPKATINLKVKADKLEHSFDFVADKNLVDLDLEKKSIPAELVETSAEKEATAQATGKKEIGEKAKGTVTVYNSYDSNSQSLNVGTKLSKNGKIFVTTKKVTVPGFTLHQGNSVPGTVDVSIVAEKEGSAYNVSAGKFSIAGFPSSQFYAQSSEAFSGGYSETVTVVSEDDVNGLKSSLTNNLTSEIKGQLKDQVSDENELLEDSVSVEELEFTTSAGVGDQKSEFTGKIKLKAQALVYKQSDFETLTNENFTKAVEEEEKELVEVDFANLKKQTKSIDLEKGQMVVSVSGDGFAAPKLDQKTLKSNLTSKDRIRAEEYLTGFVEIDSVQIELWPFWVKKIPSLEESIKINIEHELSRESDQESLKESSQEPQGE